MVANGKDTYRVMVQRNGEPVVVLKSSNWKEIVETTWRLVTEKGEPIVMIEKVRM